MKESNLHLHRAATRGGKPAPPKNHKRLWRSRTSIHPEQQLGVENPRLQKTTKDSGGVEPPYTEQQLGVENPRLQKITKDSGGVKLPYAILPTMGKPSLKNTPGPTNEESSTSDPASTAPINPIID